MLLLNQLKVVQYTIPYRYHRLLNYDNITQTTLVVAKVEGTLPSGMKVKRNSELNLLPG